MDDPTGHLSAGSFGSQNIRSLSISTNINMNINHLYNLSSRFLAFASTHVHMSEEQAISAIKDNLKKVRSILVSRNIESPLDEISKLSKYSMKIVTTHLKPQGMRSFPELMVNAMTTAYYALYDYLDTGNMSKIETAMEVIDSLIPPNAKE